MTRLFEPERPARRASSRRPLGVDFCAALIEGLDARLAGQPPEAIARVEISWPTPGCCGVLQALYLARGPGSCRASGPWRGCRKRPILPGSTPAMPPLRLRLKLADLVRRLIDRDPELAPRSAIYPLADSLADLMGEMFEERVTPEAIAGSTWARNRGHWARSQAVLGVVEVLRRGRRLTAEARQARLVDRLTRQWAEAPPEHPVLVAGLHRIARGDARLMEAVSRLPQGAVVCPGSTGTCRLRSGTADRGRRRPGLGGEDHPQYRLARVAEAAGLSPAEIPDWAPAFTPPAPRATARLAGVAARAGHRPVARGGAEARGAAEALRTASPIWRHPTRRPRPRRSRSACARRPRTGVRAALVSPTGTSPGRSPRRSTAGTSPPTTARVNPWASRRRDVSCAWWRRRCAGRCPPRRWSRSVPSACATAGWIAAIICASPANSSSRRCAARWPFRRRRTSAAGPPRVSAADRETRGLGRLGGRDAARAARTGPASLRGSRRGACRDGRGACRPGRDRWARASFTTRTPASPRERSLTTCATEAGSAGP
jgi:hypothetical protein